MRMKRHLIVFMTSIFFVLTLINNTKAQTKPNTDTNSPLVSWHTAEGVKRLERSQYKTDFFTLANHFQSQQNAFSCGPTSSAIILNSLRLNNKTIPKPSSDSIVKPSELQLFPKQYNPNLRRYTEENVHIPNVKTRAQFLGAPILFKNKEIKDYGYQLHQLDALLKAHKLTVIKRVVSDTLSETQIRQELISNMQQKDDYVLVNYKRSALQQKGSGHISPLGAYDKQSDSLLIMDVNPTQAGWVWVNIRTLISAMNTYDTIENRGYLLIRDSVN